MGLSGQWPIGYQRGFGLGFLTIGMGLEAFDGSTVLVSSTGLGIYLERIIISLLYIAGRAVVDYNNIVSTEATWFIISILNEPCWRQQHV